MESLVKNKVEMKTGSEKDVNQDKSSYENESYEPTSKEEITKNGGNIVGAGMAVFAASKWKNFHRSKRQLSRERSSLKLWTVNKDELQIIGLDDAIAEEDFAEVDTDINKSANGNYNLNQKLLTYFVKLKKSEDEQIDFDYIEQLIAQGADINCRDTYGQGMVHEAARVWHTDIMVFLLDHGANINLADDFHRTALHVAAAVNYPEMVELLLQRGCYRDAVTKGELQTPLHFAARNDAVGSLKALIKFGADVEARDYKERTPLFVAAELDRSETAKFLLEANADAMVIDSNGQLCITHMVTKMGPVARVAFDQFHVKERANRKQYYHLNLLETPYKKGKDKKAADLAKSPLEVITKYKQLDLIMHPVITRLIDVKWDQFGRRIAFRILLLNLLYVLIWTTLGVAVPWQTRYLYIFPQDGWRVFLLVCGCLMTAYYVAQEIKEIRSSRKGFKKWKSWRHHQINQDLNFCHPTWPEETRYLNREIQSLDEMLPSYFHDVWNYFDWTVYFLIFVVVLTHIIDASIPPTPPCCTLSNESVVVCTDLTTVSCNSGFVNNYNLGLWNNRIFVLTIILLWLRLMKFARAFRFLGPFIVMLGKITWDILRFFYLYLEFYIPFACGFWMLFGNIESISSMSTVDQMLFSLYRITLVDEYQFDEMKQFDVVMAYLMIGTFLGISAILCLNLFIALLSDTFQRVYDNAKANAVMQQASLMLLVEEKLSKKSKKRFRKYIENTCSPESLFYDDDLTVVKGADLKKVTVQIKEQMNELLAYVHKAETENKLSEGTPDTSSQKGGSRLKPNDKPNRLKDLLNLSTNNAKSGNRLASHPDSNDTVLNQMSELSSRMQKLQISQTAQEQTYRRLRDDMTDVKRMLMTLMPGEVKEETEMIEAWNKKPTSRSPVKMFSSSGPKLGSIAEKLLKSSSVPVDKPKSNSGFLMKMLKSSKSSPKVEDVSAKESSASRGVTFEDGSSPGALLPHVVDLELDETSGNTGVPSHQNGASGAGDATVRNPSQQTSSIHKNPDSNV